MTDHITLVPRLVSATAPLPPEIGPYTRARMTVDVDTYDIATMEEFDPAIRRALAKVTATVLCRDLPDLTWEHTETVGIDYPDSWWQHWKLDHIDSWWAGWIARRWPPRLRSETRAVTYRVDVSRALAFPGARDMPTDGVVRAEADNFPADTYDVLGPAYLHIDPPRTKTVTRIVEQP